MGEKRKEMDIVCEAGDQMTAKFSDMKTTPRMFYIFSGVLIVVFFAMILLKVEIGRYAVLGLAIGALARGFYEEKKKSDSLKNTNK